MNRIALYCILIALLVSFNARGQDAAQRTAVVLSGGGAKGVAHVGVLMALEANDIPIDYVAGTSMGGIVGGMYAAGYSPSTIKEILLAPETQMWLQGKVAGSYNYNYNRQEANASFLSVDLSIDSVKTVVNANLAKDLALNFALAEFLSAPAAAANYNFDSLFVPFRAMAAEIFTEQEVALDSGSLSNAIRATFTVPMFYRPIKLGGRYLFDGGIYNNFPVDVARKAWAPEVVIGVNVSDKNFEGYPADKDEELLSQSVFMAIIDKTDKRDLTAADVYIEPNLTGYSALDFAKIGAILDSGYMAAMRAMPEIKKKIATRRKCNEVAQRREAFVSQWKPLHFDHIEINGFGEEQTEYIRKSFNTDGEVLTIADMKQGYFHLGAEDYFNKIYPDVTYNNKTGFYDFELSGTPHKRFTVELGGNISSRNISALYLGAEFQRFRRVLSTYYLNVYTGRFYQSVQVRNRINFATRSRFYLMPVFTFNEWDYLSNTDVLFDEDDPTVLRQFDRRLAMIVGLPAGRAGKVEVEVAYFNNEDFYSNTPTFESNDVLDKLKFDGGRLSVRYGLNSLNRKQYATQGSKLSLELDFITGEEIHTPGTTATLTNRRQEHHQWLRIKLHSSQHFTKGRYLYGYTFEGLLSTQPLFANFRGSQNALPAYFPTPDTKTWFLQNFRAKSYFAVGLHQGWHLKRNVDLIAQAHIFKPLSELVVIQGQTPGNTNTFKKTFLAATAGAVYHSPIGPIAARFNYYDDPESSLGFLLHIGYLLYNRRSLE